MRASTVFKITGFIMSVTGGLLVVRGTSSSNGFAVMMGVFIMIWGNNAAKEADRHDD